MVDNTTGSTPVLPKCCCTKEKDRAQKGYRLG